MRREIIGTMMAVVHFSDCYKRNRQKTIVDCVALDTTHYCILLHYVSGTEIDFLSEWYHSVPIILIVLLLNERRL